MPHRPDKKISVSQETLAAIDKHFHSSNILILSGMPGIGKTYLANAYINSQNFNEVSWYSISSDNSSSLEKHLTKMDFQLCTYNSPKAISILKEKSKHALLIIQKDSLTEKDYQFLKDSLLGAELRLMIITTSVTPPAYSVLFETCYLNALDTDTLKRIVTDGFDMNMLNFFPLQNEKEFKTLFKIVDYNVVVLSLLNKTIHKQRNRLTKGSLLNESSWLWTSTTMPRISGSNGSNKIIFYITSLLKQFQIDQATPQEIAFLLKLSVFSSSPIGIPESMLCSLLSINADNRPLLNRYMDHCIVERYEKNYIHCITYYRMSPLFASCICYILRKSCYDILPSIRQFVETYLSPQAQLMIPPNELLEIAHTITARLMPYCAKKPDRKITEWNSQYKNWENIVTSFYAFSLYIGDINSAESLQKNYLYQFHPHFNNAQKIFSDYWLRKESCETLQNSAHLLFSTFTLEDSIYYNEHLELIELELRLFMEECSNDLNSLTEMIYSLSDWIERILSSFFSISIRNANYVAINRLYSKIVEMLDYFTKLNKALPDSSYEIAIKQRYFFFLLRLNTLYCTLSHISPFYCMKETTVIHDSLEKITELYRDINNLSDYSSDIVLKAKIYALYYLNLINDYTTGYQNILRQLSYLDSSLSYTNILNDYFGNLENSNTIGKLWSHDTTYALCTLQNSLSHFDAVIEET